ncbi:MAG: glycine cleavage T C-terminal barrel domain-containing protein, partial [Pseudomonadota bacterium]
GSITLTHMLNRRGRIEMEVTIVKLPPRAPDLLRGLHQGADQEIPAQGRDGDRYYIVCAAFFEQRLLDHLAFARRDEDVTVTALSETWSALALNGPRARDVLAGCTPAPLDNAAFRWLSGQMLEIADHTVLALRMSYAGELGWEFHMPNDALQDVYAALWQAGTPYGIADYGSFAMNVLRMEKAFKGASELTNEVTLAEADVLRFARTDKDYLGRDATLNSDLPWVCVYLEIEAEGEIDGHGGEAVLHQGQTVGSTASIVYSPTAQSILAFAYVKPSAAAQDTALEVVIHGTARPARVLSAPVYDPESLKPRQDVVRAAAE